MSSLRSLAVFAFASSLIVACEWKVMNDRGKSDDRSGGESIPSSADPPACARAGETSSCTNDPLPASCEVKVDRYKELVVINRSVLLDRRAQNNVVGAAWSFRSRMEDLAGTGGDGAAALAYAWLDQWRTVSDVGADHAPVKPRPKVSSVLVDPWRAKGGDLAAAPFRLIAIVNRPDLRHQDDGCSGSAGELRFVYTATGADKAIAMTVIIEIPYPTATRTAREWIHAWRAVAEKPFGADYNTALEALTSEVTSKSDKMTWRVRTNEIALAADSSDPWEMREFALKSEGGPLLVQIPIASTPRIELDRSASLDDWAKQNEPSIRDGSYVLPGGFQAGAAPMASASFRWSSSKMNPELRQKLSIATCNGCHAGERAGEAALPFQHIAAADQPTAYYGSSRDGETRLSRWLDSGHAAGGPVPAGFTNDELGRRETSIARALCAKECVTAATTDAGTSLPYQR